MTFPTWFYILGVAITAVAYCIDKKDDPSGDKYDV